MSQIAQASSPLPSAATAGAFSEPRVSLYDRFDPLRVKGWNIPTPGPEDTVDRRLFGVRDKLADAGIGYLFFTNTYFADNLLRHGLPAGNNRQNQLYSGQLPTIWSANFGFVTYDLSRYGVPDGQVMVGAALT